MAAAEPTERAAVVTIRSGSAASAEERSSAERSTGIKGETERETEDSKDRELRKLEEKFAKKNEQLKEARKRKREAEERALKLSEERNTLLERETAELKARSTSGGLETTPPLATAPQQPAEGPPPVQTVPAAEPSVITFPEKDEETGKERGRPRKGKAEREAEKAQKEKEDTERDRQI